MCWDCLGIAKGVAASIWGKESTTVRPKHYISYLIFDGTTVHKQAALAEKNTSLSEKSLRQWRPVPEGKGDVFC